MSDELSDKDAQKLFNEVSASLRDNDGSKLDELLTIETPSDEQLPEELPPVESEEETPAPLEPEAEQEVLEEEPTPAPEENKELAELKAQLAAISKENHALKSQAGRVPHVQRKLKELDEKLAELAKQAAVPPSDRPSTIQPKVLEKLKGIEETDPELAKAIAAAVEEATNGVANEALDRERRTLETLREQEFATYQAQEVDRLLEMYPNAPEVFSSPSWKEWKKEQSRVVQSLAGSDSADDVAKAFKFYADDMLAKHPELAKRAESAAPAPNAENDAKAKEIEEERKRKQAAATNVRTPNAPGKQSLPNDAEALFKMYSEQIRKDRLG